MKIKIYIITAAIAVILSLSMLMVDYRISLGILLSAGFSLLNMLMLSASMKTMMKDGNGNYSALIAGNIIRFALLLAVIYIGVKNPQLFNVFGLAAGFTLFMIALIIDALSRKGR